MSVLVTGAAGFVGSNLVRRLLSDGHSVRGIDSLTDYYDVQIKRRNIEAIDSTRFELITDDLNSTDIDDLLDGVQYVFHQAGQPGVRKSWGEDFKVYTQANVLATQRLLEACRRSSTIKRFVYASSSSIYGEAASFPTSESALPQPISPYGVSKLAAEHLCSLYARNFGVPTISLRYFTVYGPGQRPDMAFTRFVRAAVTNEVIRIFGSGEQIRDFTYIDDIVEANIQAAFSDAPLGAVYNVAGGSNISVNEVLAVVAEVHGSPLNVQYIQAVAGDVMRTGGSVDAFERATGWRPKVGIREGLEKQYRWAAEIFDADPEN